MVTRVTNDNLNAAYKDHVAFIDFSATWCGPCHMIAPVVEQLSGDYNGKVAFYNVDVDNNMDLARQFGIQSIPALVLLVDGKEAARTVGFQPKESLKQFIDAHIG